MQSSRSAASLLASRRSFALPSSLHSASVCPEITSRVQASHIQSRSGSAAPSVAADSSVPQLKRIPKHERRLMVESFVAKYRALNSGNFPTVSCVQKEIGGSFYVVRQILQEIKHSSKAYLYVNEHASVPGMAIDGNLSNCAMKHASHVVNSAAKHWISLDDQDFKIEKSSGIKSVDNAEKVNVPFGQPGKLSSEHVQEREDTVISFQNGKTSIVEMNGCASPCASSNEHVNEVMDTRTRAVELSSSSHLGTEIDGEKFHSSPSIGSLEDTYPESTALPKYNIMDRSKKSSKSANSSVKASHERDESNDCTTAAATHGYQIHLENEGEILPCSHRKEECPSEVVQQSHNLEAKGFPDGLKRDISIREAPDELMHGEPAEKKSSLWKNLKSFAGSIISFWRKV